MEETSTLRSNRKQIIDTWKDVDVLLLALMCVLLTWYLQFLWNRRKLYQYSWNIPGPFSLPLVGSALHFIGSPYDIFSVLKNMFNEYPGIFRLWYGHKLFYAISEPEYYEKLLPLCLNKDEWYKYGEPAVGHGLFTAPLDKWKRHRRIIMPTFNQAILDGFVEIFSEQSEILVGQMKKLVGKGEFDAFDVISKCTVDIICETAMGVKVNNQTTTEKPVSKWIDKILENIFLRSFVFYYHIDIVYNLTARSKEYRTILNHFHEFSDSVIKEKKRLFDIARTQQKDAEDFVEERNRKVFLDYLMEISADGNQFTEEELIDEVNTFIIAGSDTTAATNSFVLVMLGLHKDLQKKVYEEIIEVVGPNRAVEKEDLPKLQYMDRVIKETLRLYPLAAAVARSVDEDVCLGDIVIPGGTSMIFGILKTHTDERYWPDPYKFNPDRFLPEEVAKRHPCAYLPFSYGSRNCIGLKYATMAMKSLLATVLRKFKVSTSYRSVEDIKIKANLVVRPRDGYKLSLELR